MLMDHRDTKLNLKSPSSNPSKLQFYIYRIDFTNLKN